MYGKKWLERGNKFRVEFKYRSSPKQSVVKVVRLKVPSSNQDQADDCIRQWLLQQRKAKSKPKSKVLANMFMQAVDKDVLQSSYHDMHDMKKRKNFGQTSAKSSPAEPSPAVITKLKRARYTQKKREERQSVKHKCEMQVTRQATNYN